MFTQKAQRARLTSKREPVATIPILRQSAAARVGTAPLAGFPERLVSAAALAAVSPVIGFTAAAVALLSGQSPFIAHRRVGWHGSALWMLKLRTMWDPADRSPRRSWWIEYIDDPEGPESKRAEDPRVPNAFARFCRRHSIDELPQLLQVIRGEMALVGPRPLTAAELRRHYGSDSAEVLEAKPGIAGLWQISGRNRLTYRERRALDLELVRGCSPRLYLRILVRTLAQVWTGANSW